MICGWEKMASKYQRKNKQKNTHIIFEKEILQALENKHKRVACIDA